MSAQKPLVQFFMLVGIGGVLAGCMFGTSTPTDTATSGNSMEASLTLDLTESVTKQPTFTPEQVSTLTPTSMHVGTAAAERVSRIWYIPTSKSGFWTMDRKGENRSLVPNSVCCPSFDLSPNRTQCAYYASTDDNRWEAGILKFIESCEPIVFLPELDTEDLLYRWSFDEKYVGITTRYPIEADVTRMLYVIEIETGYISAIEADVISFSWVPGQHKLLILAGGLQRYGSGWHLIEPDGTEIRFLAEGVVDRVEYSPDGQRVALVQKGSKGIDRLFICDADGANCTEMTPDWEDYEYGNAWWPTWSPDGGKIVFFARYVASVVEGKRQWTEGAFVVDVVTGEQGLLCEDLLYPPIVWSPDGTEIVGVDMSTEFTGIYIISLETGERTVLEQSDSREVHQLLEWIWADEE